MDSKFKQLSDKKNELKKNHEQGILLIIDITLGHILVQICE